jgi:fructose transport system ATP-binding protein
MQAKGLVKRYGQVTALDGADFELRAGEILAVIGDNGAGKSSLIKACRVPPIPDEGEILLDGQPIHFKSPMDARRAGIETVLPGPGRGPGHDHRREPVPGPRAAPPRPVGQRCCACWTRRRCWKKAWPAWPT